MSLCATLVLQEYPDIIFSFGFSDEYRWCSSSFSLFFQLIHFFFFANKLLGCSFVFKQTTKFYQRRARFFNVLLHVVLYIYCCWGIYLSTVCAAKWFPSSCLSSLPCMSQNGKNSSLRKNWNTLLHFMPGRLSVHPLRFYKNILRGDNSIVSIDTK
jgi:hypothetical protein